MEIKLLQLSYALGGWYSREEGLLVVQFLMAVGLLQLVYFRLPVQLGGRVTCGKFQMKVGLLQLHPRQLIQQGGRIIRRTIFKWKLDYCY